MIKELIKKYSPPIFRPAAKFIYRKFKKFSPAEIEYHNLMFSLKTNFVELNKNAKENQVIIREGICLYVHPESRFGFEHFCYISPDMVNEMDMFIEKTNNKKALLDIGALHGIFSLVFAVNHPDKKVVAVDPSALAFARLLYNVYKNDLKNVTCCDYALSDVPGTLNMHYEWEHAVAAGTSKPGYNGFEVVTKTGDELCQSLSFEPDVIKLDVEGHEVKVLKGLQQTLERLQPLIFLEIHPERIAEEGNTINELCLILKQYGYKAFLPGNTIISYEEICSLKHITRLLLESPEL